VWIIGVTVAAGGVLCVLQTVVGALQLSDCDTEWIIGVNVVTGGVLCVLQPAVASLQSPDCDTEGIIIVNVVTGGVLRRKGIVRFWCSFAVDTDWVHKTVNQYVSLYLKLAINTEL
jgi:hypothetical protein